MAKKTTRTISDTSIGEQVGAQMARPWVPYIMAVLFFIAESLCFDVYDERLKLITVILGTVALVAALLRFSALRQRCTLPFCALALYVFLDGLAALYAAQRASGTVALYTLLSVLAAFCIVLTVTALAPDEGQAPGRWLGTVLTGFAGIASLLSIDSISTRLLSGPVLSFIDLLTDNYSASGQIEVGARMSSIFGDPNVFAGVAALGVLLGLGLATTEAPGWRRHVHLVLLSLNSLAFVLAFSMGGMGTIALAFLAYLLLERREQLMGTFLLMLETLVPTAISAMLISMTSFTAWTGIRLLPLVCAAVSSAVICLLDRFVGRKFGERLAGKSKLAVIGITAVIVAAFLVVAVNWTGSVTLQAGESLRRAAYPEPGEYALVIEADGEINVTVESQDQEEAMMHTNSVLYQGPASGASFTVPEGSKVVYFNFSAPVSVQFDSATYDGPAGSGSLPLGYKLLPGFMANRLQGFFANENAIQRLVFFQDGLKLFAQSPIIGLGLSGFQANMRAVQSFWYRTQNVHNHYIEVMVDKGIVGLIVFVALLAVSAAAVWFERRKKDEGDPLAPCLGAALVFLVGNAAVEVIFSDYHSLPMVFGIFAMIAVTCGNAIPVLRLKKAGQTAAAGATAAMVLALCVLICGNMAAARMVERENTFASAKTAVQIDVFEWTKYAIRYLQSVGSASEEDGVDGEIMYQADKYAALLEDKPDFDVPYYLAEFYLNTDRTTAGLEMAEEYVERNASDSTGWQDIFDLLLEHNEDSEEYRAGVMRIVERLDRWNEENMGEIQLSAVTQVFIESVREGIYLDLDIE